MPAVTRKGDNCTGHDACPPRPSIEGEPSVSVAGRDLMRVGHAYAAHGCPAHPPHGAVLASGAPHASLTGQPIGRIGDAVSCGSAVAQGEGSVTIGDSGGKEYGNATALDLVYDPAGKMIRCLPAIAAAEAERADGVDRQGWLYLHDMFRKWLQRPARYYPDLDPEPFWVDWDWVMSWSRARAAYQRLTWHKNMAVPYDLRSQLEQYPLTDSQLKEGGEGLNIVLPNNIYNPAARAKLAQYLLTDGKLTKKDEPFDYTTLPWQKWWDRHFNYCPVRRGAIIDGLNAALATFTLRALARGQAQPNGKGGHHITLTGAAVYVDDRFAFQDNDDFFYWSCEQKKFLGVFPSGGDDHLSGVILLRFQEDGSYHLSGRTFLDFQNRYNLGNDFLVLSPLHEVEEFQEIGYEFP